MTEPEYSRRLAIITNSDAPIEQRDAAILQLEEEFNKNSSIDRAIEAIIQSEPDISDIANAYD